MGIATRKLGARHQIMPERCVVSGDGGLCRDDTKTRVRLQEKRQRNLEGEGLDRLRKEGVDYGRNGLDGLWKEGLD